MKSRVNQCEAAGNGHGPTDEPYPDIVVELGRPSVRRGLSLKVKVTGGSLNCVGDVSPKVEPYLAHGTNAKDS